MRVARDARAMLGRLGAHVVGNAFHLSRPSSDVDSAVVSRRPISYPLP